MRVRAPDESLLGPISGEIGGAEADAVYSGTDIVPLLSQVTMLELGGGLTGRINAAVSVFANVDYQFAVGAAENEKRNGVRGAFGAKYTWSTSLSPMLWAVNAGEGTALIEYIEKGLGERLVLSDRPKWKAAGGTTAARRLTSPRAADHRLPWRAET
jgi:hypothetical protein